MKCFYNIQLAQDFWHKPDVITIWFGAFITAQICNTINWFQPTDFIKALWHIIFEQRQTGLVTLFSTPCANHTKIIHIDLFNMFSNFFFRCFSELKHWKLSELWVQHHKASNSFTRNRFILFYLWQQNDCFRRCIVVFTFYNKIVDKTST